MAPPTRTACGPCPSRCRSAPTGGRRCATWRCWRSCTRCSPPSSNNRSPSPPERRVESHGAGDAPVGLRSEEHTSELQSRQYLVCRLLLEKKKEPTSCRQTNLTSDH